VRVRRAAACLALIVVALAGGPAVSQDAPATAPPAPEPPAAAPPAPKWDRAANIREAAQRIGTIQRTRGAEAAINFIDACYRTHGLASAYSAAFEGCIAQDYLQSNLLARIYSRLPPEQLKKMGAPTAQAIAQSMGRRVVSAFRQYKVGTVEAEAFKADVDKHGLPVFLKTVFPGSTGNIDKPGGGPDSKTNDPAANGPAPTDKETREKN
jgi:hypothetical protein